MVGSRGHAFPLSSASRRRRQLVLRHDPVTDAGPVSVAAANDPLILQAPATHSGLPPGEFDAQAAGNERITRVLAARDPRTWLIAGESFLPLPPEGREWPGLIDRFTAQLRGPLGRRRDTVVDACCAGSTLTEFRGRLDALSAAAPADVVLLLCGPADARAGVAGLSRFEANLNVVAGHFSASGTAVVVSTSPVPWCSPEDVCDISYDVYAEAVRACAIERELLLVDHRGHWEREAVPPGGTGSWFDGTPEGVGAPGHVELARLLFGALWRCRPVGSSTGSTQSREDAEIRQASRRSRINRVSDTESGAAEFRAG